MASMLSLALLQKKVPDGDIRNVRGAKRGGYTDHLAGVHLIPNVGREAMVPAECVKRQPRPVKKEPPKAPPPAPKVAKQPKTKPQERRRRSPSRRRSRSRSRSRRRSRSSSSENESEDAAVWRLAAGACTARKPAEEERRRAKSPDAETKRRNEEERQRQRQREIEAYRDCERKRGELERVKLEAFKEAQMRRKELDSVRKKRLSGAFALDEDDIPEDGEGVPPKALSARPRTASLVPVDAPGPLPYAGGASSAALRIADGENVTAADLDGSQHDHKFSAVWKDWNAQKRDDPGEIAKQFMKIAAIKRRGFDPLSRRRG